MHSKFQETPVMFIILHDRCAAHAYVRHKSVFMRQSSNWVRIYSSWINNLKKKTCRGFSSFSHFNSIALIYTTPAFKGKLIQVRIVSRTEKKKGRRVISLSLAVLTTTKVQEILILQIYVNVFICTPIITDHLNFLQMASTARVPNSASRPCIDDSYVGHAECIINLNPLSVFLRLIFVWIFWWMIVCVDLFQKIISLCMHSSVHFIERICQFALSLDTDYSSVHRVDRVLEW